jgi:hypothetical protein
MAELGQELEVQIRCALETALGLDRDKEQLSAVTQAQTFLDDWRKAARRLGQSPFKSSRFGDLRVKFG